MTHRGGIWQRVWRIIVALALTSTTLLSFGAPNVSACYTWQVGARVGLREGAEIRTGPGLGYSVHTTLPPGANDWPVDIIDGPRYADGREWWDTSRRNIDGGGTGWVDKAQAAWDLCSSNPPTNPGNVYVQSGLELQPDPNHSWPPMEGDKLIGRFTLGNNGGQNIRIDNLGVRMRRTGDEYWDFLRGGSVDLSPGQTVRFDQNNERPLATGHYRAEITWQVSGQWHVTDAREFDVATRPNPYNVYVASGLELVSDPNHGWPPVVGDKLIGRFTIGNNGGQGVQLERYGVRLFRNGTENLSFLNNGGSVYLNPGQTVRFDQNNEYQLPAGHYRAEITWQIGTQWHVTGGQEFDVSAAQTPGNLALAEPLTFASDGSGQWPPQQGDKLIAHIRVANVGDQSLSVQHIGVRGWRNGSENWDIGWFSVDIAGHTMWSLDPNNERALEAGDYAFRVSYSLDGSNWVELGNEVTFTVGAAVTPEPTYTVSGRITDASGTGLAGVTVAAGIVTTTTDSAGHYALAGLSAGLHVVTPMRDGYTFSPSSRSARVAGDCLDIDFVGTAHDGSKPWLLMYYLAGDNEDAMSSNYAWLLDKLRTRTGNPNYNIAVLYDGNPDATTDGYPPRYYYIADNVSFVSIDEPNMGDPATLASFVTWARGMYPADHTALIIADHGSLAGIAFDRSSPVPSDPDDIGYDRLSYGDLSTAFSSIVTSGGKIDVVFLFACLMGSLESGYQLRDATDYVVASEQVGWDPISHEYLNRLADDTTPQALARALADDYHASLLSRDDPHTISVAQLSALPNLIDATREFSTVLRSQMGDIADVLLRQSVLRDVQRFDSGGDGTIDGRDELVDLYDLARLVADRTTSPELQSSAREVMAAIEGDGEGPAYIIHAPAPHSADAHDTGYYWDVDNSHGVSVFFPSTWRSFYNGNAIDFAAGTDWGSPTGGGAGLDPVTLQAEPVGAGWGAMLVEYIRHTNPDAPDNPYPPPPVAPRQHVLRAYVPLVMHR